MTRNHMLQSILLIAAVWLILRSLGMIGPDPVVDLSPGQTKFLWVSIALISLWGLARLMSGSGSRGGGSG